ncbi:MAG: GntR family transcriptional regulator [Oscillospiraceae bacterium]|nr:GntR family transcriptional regulator [Oscillospiraceae bacterium]
MNEFKSVSLADRVFEKLENDIITGVYPRGEILTELKLVETLGVSRTPIRESLRRLEQERLIADTGKGSVVLGITVDDLLDIMDIRQRIEGLAAYYATKNLTDESKDMLLSICDRQDFYYSRHDLESLRKVDDQFHHAIYELCGRTVIRDTLVPLHKKTQRFRRGSLDNDERLRCSVQEHRAICDAICSADAEKAEALIQKHIANAKVSMIERFQNNG